MHLPFESVTTVDIPSDALLVEELPEPPEWLTVPPGPVVVPLTLPLPAVIDVDTELEGGDSPFFNSTTLQLSVEEDVELDEPAPDVELLVLLELV